MRAGLLATALLATTACKPLPAGGSANLAVASVESPVGVMLISACTPTGPELCFNATDDNCNGVIDEGCGVSTGPLQFTIAWGDSPADVNLAVRDPAGDKVDGSQSSKGGLRHDRDCPRENCNGQNVENVYFDGSDPPKGRYVVDIELHDPHAAPLPIRVRFGARAYSKSFGADIDLAKRGDTKTFAFSI